MLESASIERAVTEAKPDAAVQLLTALPERGPMRELPRGCGLVGWIYIDDAAAAVVAGFEKGRAGQAYNIVDDAPASMGEFGAGLASLVGTKVKRMPMWVARLAAPYIT